MIRLNLPYKLLLLCLLILGLYYTTITGGTPNSIDDYKMLMDFELQDTLNYTDLFLPNEGLYYRPLLTLSFWADKSIWMMEPSFMLLENIFFHLGSSIVIFFITNTLFNNERTALLASLLFAVHPLATESLNWVSGRTDPMATFFHLIASLSLLLCTVRKKNLFLACAIFFSIAGILSKEMSFVFVLANAGLLFLSPVPQDNNRKTRIQLVALFLAPFFFAGISFLLYRHLHHGPNARGISWIITNSGSDIVTTLTKILTIFGFYVKKLFIPMPLNFAIETISPYYLWFGTLLLPTCYFLYRSAKPWANFFLLSFLMIAPAIVLGLTHIAWTAYAERYIYQALPFLCMGLAVFLAALDTDIRFQRYSIPLTVIILLFATFWTLQRNLLWSDKLAFFEDTVAQSPNFATVRNEIAVAYIQQDREDDARKHLEQGIALDKKHSSSRNQILYANLAMLQLQHYNNPIMAQQILDEVLNREEDVSNHIIKAQINIYDDALKNTTSKERQNDLRAKIIKEYQHLYATTGKAFYLYQAGKQAKDSGLDKDATDFFQKAASVAPENAFFKKAALIMPKKND